MLILDEPTNHLDLDAREALEDALPAFDGAVLLVSHDRALLDAVGTRTVAIEDGRAAQLPGRLGRVLARARGARRGRRAAKRVKASAAGSRGGEARGGPSKNARQAGGRPRARRGEGRGRACAAGGRAGRPVARGATPSRAGKSTRRHAEAKRAVEEAYSRWEEATALTSGSEA